MRYSLAIAFALAACSTVRTREHIVFYGADNKPQTEVELVDGERSGSFSLWYENGNRKISCSRQQDASVLCEHYYPSGQLLRSFTRAGEVLQGKFAEYYSNGQLRISGGFIQGDRHGLWQVYSPQGEVVRMIHYSRDLITSILPEEAPECVELTQDEIIARRNFKFVLVEDWCENFKAHS